MSLDGSGTPILQHFGVLVEFSNDNRISAVLFRCETQAAAEFLHDAINQFPNSNRSVKYPPIRYVSQPLALGRTL